eukprot:6473576-Amphidinium_carterae.3
MPHRRAQSDGPYGRQQRTGPGVSYSEKELTRASEDQEARNERARRQFLDRSLRDARPTPPAAPPKPADYSCFATVPVTPTAPTTAVNEVQETGSTAEEVTMDPPEQSYMQQALSILQGPFRRNKKRGLSTGGSRGSSSDVFPSPRSHIQQQPQQPP